MAIVKIPGSQLVRDTKSMALLNTDSNAKNEYLSKVKMLKNQRDEINKVNTEIVDLKKDMSEIKELLLKLMDKGVNG